jgi:hypothetical protein
MSKIKPARNSGQLLGRWQNSAKIVLVVAIGIFVFRPQIADWFKVSPPSEAVAQLATATTMTDDAQQIFYRQDPKIKPKPAFFQSCQKSGKLEEGLVAFGCYLSNGRTGKIFIQSVSDNRFQGIMEVAAAHEMLHAVYMRLSQAERDDLAPRLKTAARRVKDRRLLSVLQKYEKTDEALYVNELHSHLGTELGDLADPVLEQHYQKYFRDRQQVVALAQQSQATLRKLDRQAEQLKAEITDLETSLKSTKQTLKADEQALESAQQNLDTLQANLISFKEQAEQRYREGTGSPTLVTEFEQMRSNYNEQVREHNIQVEQYQTQFAEFKAQVDRYKQKVNAYNAVAREERSLFAELEANPMKSLKDKLDDPVKSLPSQPDERSTQP